MHLFDPNLTQVPLKITYYLKYLRNSHVIQKNLRIAKIFITWVSL
jgi:hypothetical protein